jgi:hypothetical protein
VSDSQIETAAALWNLAGDTQDMAEMMLLPEAKIYNHLQFIRRRASELKTRLPEKPDYF